MSIATILESAPNVVSAAPAPKTSHNAAAAVVIAAYNEADNIEAVVRGASRHANVIVVDDASKDDTARIAKDAGAQVLRHQRNTHIKQAFLDGFQAALAAGASVVLQMDAGLSHDADEIPRLIDGLKHADMIIGSRFVPGGRLVDQPANRRRLSQVGSFLVRRTTGLRIADLTSGFKAYRRHVLETLFESGAVNNITARAFAFQFQLTAEVHKLGFRIAEVPITYRATGSSLNRRVVWEALGACGKLLFTSRSTAHAADSHLKTVTDAR